ncbi:MAG: ATP-binding protein [Deltaproteobacteria bacterium]|nr:ATP-binding protein [Deltaproteobacteria bacterium]
MKSSLFQKVFGSYILMIVLALVGMSFFMIQQIEVSFIREVKDDLTARSRIMAMMPGNEIENKIKTLADVSHARITLVDPSGRVIVDSEKNISEMESHLNRPEIQEVRIKGHGEAIRFSHSLGVDMFYVASPIMDGSELKGYIRLARPLFDVKRSTDQIYHAMYWFILIVASSSLIVAFLFSRKFVSPIRKIGSYTQKICDGENPGTLLVESDDEIGQLAKNINCMVEQYREKVRYADEERGKLESAFASMIEGVVVLNNQKRIELMNKGMNDIIGPRYSIDVIGKTSLEAFRNLDLQNALEIFDETKRPISQEISLGDENPVILNVNISAIHGLPGNEEKTMMVFHDITRLKKLERMREDFVANVTHEIKTPLTAIIGFIETLQDGAIEEILTAKTFLNTIDENARRLNRLVDDLLTLSNIELGEMTLRLEEVSVGEVVDHVLPIFEGRAQDKNLKIDKNLPERLSMIHADRDRVVQVLLNVIDNAVKFTPDGGSVTIKAYEEGKDSVVIQVVDTGVGIPKSEMPRLGERFYRVDRARSRELGGTGLGLSIVKHLMKAHQGRVEIESKMGAGTTLSLYFPVYQGSYS